MVTTTTLARERADQLDLATGAGLTQILAATNAHVAREGKKGLTAGVADFLGFGGGLVETAVSAATDLFMGKGFRFKHHGAWGGPGYSAGRYTEPSEPLTLEDLAAPAEGPVDEAFKRHDIAYTRAALQPSKEQRIEALREADRVLIGQLQAAVESGKIEPTDFDQLSAASQAILLFKGKLATDAYGDTTPLAIDPRDAAAWDLVYADALGEDVADLVADEGPLPADSKEDGVAPKAVLTSNDEDTDYAGYADDVRALLEPTAVALASGQAVDKDALRAQLDAISRLLSAIEDGDEVEFD